MAYWHKREDGTYYFDEVCDIEGVTDWSHVCPIFPIVAYLIYVLMKWVIDG